MGRKQGSALIAAALMLGMAFGPQPALPHPLGNLSINQYAQMCVQPYSVELRYIVDMAEIPDFQELQECGVTAKEGDPSRDKKFRQHVNELYDRWTKRFEFLFWEGIKKGEFINIDNRVATLTLICLIDGFIYRSVGSGELDIERDVRVVFEEFMKTVSPPTEH